MISQKKNKGIKLTSSRKFVLSSGIPSLDFVLGGGIPVGSIFLVEEGQIGGYAKTMLKYFLAEGIVCNHKIIFASRDTNGEQFIASLPAPTNISDAELDKDKNKDDEMKIAWRYNKMAPVESLMESQSQFSHHFDLGKTIDPELVKDSSVHIFDSSSDSYISYKELLKYIQENLDGNSTSCSETQQTNISRIGIESLGSPFWQFDSSDLHKNMMDLRQFLQYLRSILISSNAVAYITIPTHLFLNESIVDRIRMSVDTCVKLDSFAGTDREDNPALKDYHGLFYIPKISDTKSLINMESRIFDLAFKLRRKKFLIEKLHLPPELQESAEREQDDVPSISCSSSRKLDIDF